MIALTLTGDLNQKNWIRWGFDLLYEEAWEKAQAGLLEEFCSDLNLPLLPITADSLPSAFYVQLLKEPLKSNPKYFKWEDGQGIHKQFHIVELYHRTTAEHLEHPLFSKDIPYSPLIMEEMLRSIWKSLKVRGTWKEGSLSL